MSIKIEKDAIKKLQQQGINEISIYSAYDTAHYSMLNENKVIQLSKPEVEDNYSKQTINNIDVYMQNSIKNKDNVNVKLMDDDVNTQQSNFEVSWS